MASPRFQKTYPKRLILEVYHDNPHHAINFLPKAMQLHP